MPKYEFCIAVKDEPEAHRKKAGDIIAVKPYPCDTGWLTMRDHLVVVVESNETLAEMMRYKIRYYSGGPDILPDIPGVPLAKRKYQIPLDILKDGWYPSLDLLKVENKTYPYQPFKKASELAAPYTGKDGRLLQDAEDLDCGLTAEQEIVIDMTEAVSLIYDKHKASFKYSTKKIA